MRRLRLVMLLGGLALAFYGFQEFRLSGTAKAEPQEITCDELARNGYGDNAHVRLGNWFFAPSTFVYEKSKRSEEWNHVFVPLLPLDGDYAQSLRELPEGTSPPAPKRFGVILKSSEVSNNTELNALGEAETLEGVVINKIDSLDRKTKDLLSRSYPEVDFDACWILEHERKVKGPAIGLLIVLAGLAAMGGGGFLMFKDRAAKAAAKRTNAQPPPAMP